MCSSSGFPLWHWWSQWRLGKIETRYLLSHIWDSRQLPEIGFHMEVRGSATYNCHGFLFCNNHFKSILFSSPPLTLSFTLAGSFFAVSFIYHSHTPSAWHCSKPWKIHHGEFCLCSDCMHRKPVLWRRQVQSMVRGEGGQHCEGVSA